MIRVRKRYKLLIIGCLKNGRRSSLHSILRLIYHPSQFYVLRSGTTYFSSLDKYLFHILPWILMINTAAESTLYIYIYASVQSTFQRVTDTIRSVAAQTWWCCTRNAHSQQHRHLRQFWKRGPDSAKPLTFGPFMKTPNSGQLNTNIHISFRKLLHNRCHGLLRQVWAGLSRMQSLCMHKNSTGI